MSNSDKIMAVYMIKNNVTEHFYIGATKDFMTRKYSHISTLSRNGHANKLLQKAFNFYGKEAFSFYLLERAENRTQLLKRERELIQEMNPHYNLHTGVPLSKYKMKVAFAKPNKLQWRRVNTVRSRHLSQVLSMQVKQGKLLDEARALQDQINELTKKENLRHNNFGLISQ